MKTITMKIDEATLAKAEQKAASLHTSVGEVVENYLRQWASGAAIGQGQAVMLERFKQADWQFAVGTPDTREQRIARS